MRVEQQGKGETLVVFFNALRRGVDQLDAEALELGISRAELIRQILGRHLRLRRSKVERVRASA